MTRKYAYFDAEHGYGFLTFDDGDDVYEITTTMAGADRYIRVDDGRQYPQLCDGGGFRGNTLTWAKDPDKFGYFFARDCKARYYKTRAGYDRAVAQARTANAAPWGSQQWAETRGDDLGESPDF